MRPDGSAQPAAPPDQIITSGSDLACTSVATSWWQACQRLWVGWSSMEQYSWREQAGLAGLAYAGKLQKW